MIWLPRGNAKKFHAQTIRKKKVKFYSIIAPLINQNVMRNSSSSFLMNFWCATRAPIVRMIYCCHKWLAAEWLFWQNNNETLKETYNRRLLLSPLNTFLEVNWPIVVLSYGFAHSHCNILLSSQYIQYKCHIGRTIYHHWFDMPFAALIFYSCR